MHTQSPISTAAKASGVTPKTTTLISSSQQVPSSNAATITSATATESPYPAARPGAAPAPAPTGSAPGRASGPSPTRTTSDGGPPPPQPAAVPVPFSTAIKTNTDAPQAVRSQASPTAVPHPYAPQTSLPSPIDRDNYPAQPPGSTTSTSTTSSQNFRPAVSLSKSYTPVYAQSESRDSGDHARRHSIGRPPGYVQNPYAAEPSPSRRATTAGQESGVFGAYGGGEQGALRGEEGVWDAAKRWARVAGEKVGEAESEVWKRLNK